jgi:hypothetical protein
LLAHNLIDGRHFLHRSRSRNAISQMIQWPKVGVNHSVMTNAQVESWTFTTNGTAAMAIVPLRSHRTSQPELLHHLLEYGDIVGKDTAGRTIIQLAVDDRVLETLMTFDAAAAELEAEPEAGGWSPGRGRARAAKDGGATAGRVSLRLGGGILRHHSLPYRCSRCVAPINLTIRSSAAAEQQDLYARRFGQRELDGVQLFALASQLA